MSYRTRRLTNRKDKAEIHHEKFKVAVKHLFCGASRELTLQFAGAKEATFGIFDLKEMGARNVVNHFVIRSFIHIRLL
jgi:hypothetical protein